MSGSARNPKHSECREIRPGLVPVGLAATTSAPAPNSLVFFLVGRTNQKSKSKLVRPAKNLRVIREWLVLQDLTIIFHTDLFKYYLDTLDRNL